RHVPAVPAGRTARGGWSDGGSGSMVADRGATLAVRASLRRRGRRADHPSGPSLGSPWQVEPMRRITLALLAVAQLSGCVGWRPQSVGPRELLATKPQDVIKVATADSTKGITVYSPRI